MSTDNHGTASSIDKCGTVLTMEMFEEAAHRIAQQGYVPEPILVSPGAFKLLQKIQRVYPGFYPMNEGEIWIKAYRMGLIGDRE